MKEKSKQVVKRIRVNYPEESVYIIKSIRELLSCTVVDYNCNEAIISTLKNREGDYEMLKQDLSSILKGQSKNLQIIILSEMLVCLEAEKQV